MNLMFEFNILGQHGKVNGIVASIEAEFMNEF